MSELDNPLVAKTGQYILRQRTRAGLTQAAAGHKLGRRASVISDLESGQRVLTPKFAVRLAGALNENDPRELVAQAINIMLKREGLNYRITRGGLLPG